MDTQNQLELSLENLNNSVDKLKGLFKDYSKLNYIAEKYDRQYKQLKNLSESFKESARIARLRN